MRILRTSFSNPSRNIIDEAVKVMENNGVVVGITDTVYGVFANPFKHDTVDKVYRVKKRVGKPIPVLASDTSDVIKVAQVEPWVTKLLKIVWPGPITVVLPVKENVFPEILHQGRESIGFRVPAAPLPRKIAARLGGFVTGTSANISGLKPAETIDEAIKQLGESIDLYIDSGLAPLRTPSTVIEVDAVNKQIRVIREGAISRETINMMLSIISRM